MFCVFFMCYFTLHFVIVIKVYMHRIISNVQMMKERTNVPSKNEYTLDSKIKDSSQRIKTKKKNESSLTIIIVQWMAWSWLFDWIGFTQNGINEFFIFITTFKKTFTQTIGNIFLAFE